MVTILILSAPFPPLPVEEFRPANTAGWVLSFLPVVVLPFRRRWPLLALIALLVVFGAAAFTGTLSPGAGIAVAVAMFNVTTQSSRGRGMVISGIAIALTVLLCLPAALGSVLDPRVLQFGLIVAFGAAAGEGARSRREYIAAIMERAQRAEQTREAEAKRRVSEERLKIARDLHDTVAHQIAVINLNAGVASSAVDTRPEKAKEALSKVRVAGRTVLGEIGALLTLLRADDDAQPLAPQPDLNRIDDLVSQFRTVRMETTVRVNGDLSAVGDAVSRVAYRVIQESLTNAHKHGIEHRAHVLVLVHDEELTVVVANPVDFPAGESRETTIDGRGPGFGLTGLRERVASVRGIIEAGPDLGGWKVTARLPLTKESAT